MPGPWLTDDEVKDRLAGILQLQGGRSALDPVWDEVVLRCHASAWKAVRSILMGRGYSALQLDSWDERQEYEGDVAAAFCLRDPAAPQTETFRRMEGEESDYAVPDDPVVVRHLDRRPELYTLTLVAQDGTVILPPEDAIAGAVGFGSMRTDDVFREPCCPPRAGCCGWPPRTNERFWSGW
jgi:hypothetical protein